MSGVMFDKILGRIREGGDEGGGGDNYALIENTPQIITPSVDGSIVNLTAEEIENFRVGDIVKDNLLVPLNGPMRDWLVSSIKDDTVVLVYVGEDAILSIVWTKSGNVWSYDNGGSITYNNVAKKISIATTVPQNGMSTNTLYNLGVISQNTTFLINPAQEVGIANVWTWTFSTGSTAPTITWPAQITMWSNGEAPEIEANKYYEVSVMNGVGTVISADIPQEEETEVEP